MKLEELINIIDNKLESDIKSKSRKRNNVYARKLYCKLAYECVKEIEISEYGVEIKTRYRYQDIADTLNVNHDLIYYHRTTFDAVNDRYKNVYNEIIDEYDLDIRKLGVKKTYAPVLSEAQKTLLNDLKKLSDSDILEFRETRLKPYLNMLKTSVKQKQAIQVVGARLIR